jgi:hypothetical protein
MLSGEWERAPEVRMAPALRELVEDTIRNQTAQYPDAILSATRDVTDGNANGNSPPAINIDAIALTRQLEGLGFRRAHVKNVVRVMDEAAKRIYDNGGANGGGGIDPLVLALTTLSPQEAAIEWLILHLPEVSLLFLSLLCILFVESVSDISLPSLIACCRTISLLASARPPPLPTSSPPLVQAPAPRPSSRPGSSKSSSRRSGFLAKPSRAFSGSLPVEKRTTASGGKARRSRR